MADINSLFNYGQNQFSTLLKLPDTSDRESVQRDLARQTTQHLAQQHNLTESEARGMQAAAAQGYFENKGLTGADFDAAIAKQFGIINATQADVGSFRLWLAKFAPQISSASSVAGFGLAASRAIQFARVVSAGGSLAAGFAAMGPLGYVAAGLIALSYILPSALNTSNDFTAMQPTMMLSYLSNAKKEYDKGTGIGVTDFGSFTESNISDLFNAIARTNITGYSDPLAGQSRLITQENVKDSMRLIVGDLNARGITPQKKEVIAIMGQYINAAIAVSPNREVRGAGVGGVFGAARPTGVASAFQSKTAKPKLFLGTVFGGKVAEMGAFVRQLDDKITSEEDLVNDVMINMTGWLAKLPGRLTYDIQIKNNPQDTEGVSKQGVWAVLDLYFQPKQAKRIFVEEVLLGPLDPIVYYPETTRLQSITFKIPEELTPQKITPLQISPSALFTVDGLSTWLSWLAS